MPADRTLFWMRFGVAFLWLATALAVIHPYYREVGAEYLARIGLPWWVMLPTCALEFALGVRILAAPVGGLLTAFQFVMVATFTIILAVAEPGLLVHPFGMLSKNLPFLGLLATVCLVEREGWTPRAKWVLRGGMAVVWFTEGLIPKVLFQQPMELAVVANSGLVPFDPGLFLGGLGLLQVASGIAALTLSGRLLGFVLLCQAGAVILLPALVSAQDMLLWVHPFGPMTKNVPIFVGTVVAYLRCSR